MKYSEQFKTRIVSKLVGPDALSANALSGEVGISQATLSRWLREAGTVPVMAKKQHPRKDTTVDKPLQDWPVEERLRVVVEALALTDDELGAFLRREGLHQAQLDSWTAAALGSMSPPPPAKRAAGDSKRIKTLERELRRKDKALAETAALLVLQKKVQEIWGDEGDDT
jgi:transposase-like protein